MQELHFKERDLHRKKHLGYEDSSSYGTPNFTVQVGTKVFSYRDLVSAQITQLRSRQPNFGQDNRTSVKTSELRLRQPAGLRSDNRSLRCIIRAFVCLTLVFHINYIFVSEWIEMSLSRDSTTWAELGITPRKVIAVCSSFQSAHPLYPSPLWLSILFV